MFLRHNILWIIWSLVIIGLCITPGKELPRFEWNHFLTLDKLAHVFVYALLVVLMMTGFNKQLKYDFLRERATFIVVPYAVFLGLLLEFIQHFLIADRTFEWSDVLANSIGVAIGLYAFYLVYRKCLVRG